MASLKPYNNVCFSQLTLAGFPRPKGRGLIEAESPRALQALRSSFPRPKGRGLIEASMFSSRTSRTCYFHGRKAVASLKRPAPAPRPHPRRTHFHGRKAVASLKQQIPSKTSLSSMQFPRPKGRGLIEAILKHGWIGYVGSPFPRPKGRGLIEAQ